MELNKLYEKCKDRKSQLYQISSMLSISNRETRKTAMYYEIKAYFFNVFTNEGLELHKKSTVGGDWLLYEWNRYLDEVQADEKMKTFPRLDKTINDLRKYKKHDISTTQLINTLILEIMADIWSGGLRYIYGSVKMDMYGYREEQ